MRQYFTFDGKDCRDFSLYVNGHKTFNSPVRKYSLYNIPGRNGDIAEDIGSFENVELTYGNSFIFENFDQNFSDLKNFLLSRSGYKRLTDTYHPDEYRMALFRKAIEPTMNESNEVGAFDLVFECQPQRFLLSGETPMVFVSSGQITNPTMFASKPLIRVYGTGKINVGGMTVEVLESDNYVDIDCSTMDCYKNSINCNANVRFSKWGYLTIPPGDSNVRIESSTINSIRITPRWFRL